MTSPLMTRVGPASAVPMMRVVAYAETIGLIPASRKAGVDPDDFQEALDALAKHGLARRITPAPRPSDVERVARATMDAIEASPIPAAEWRLVDVLGDPLAAQVGTSVSSMARYRGGERRTPDDVAGRLHVLAQVVSDLSGSYNEYGIRRWFDRPRQALDGRAPRDILSGAWDPESPDVERVRKLAEALVTV